MEPRVLHSRFAALAIGVLVALCVVVAICLAFPAQNQVREGAEYSYVYSGVKSSSVDFVEANLDDE